MVAEAGVAVVLEGLVGAVGLGVFGSVFIGPILGSGVVGVDPVVVVVGN